MALTVGAGGLKNPWGDHKILLPIFRGDHKISGFSLGEVQFDRGLKNYNLVTYSKHFRTYAPYIFPSNSTRRFIFTGNNSKQNHSNTARSMSMYVENAFCAIIFI